MRVFILVSGIVLSMGGWACADLGSEFPAPSETFEVKREGISIKEGPPDKFIKGSFLVKSQAFGPPTPFLVDATSIIVKKDGEVMALGKDYGVDPIFASLGTLPGGRLLPGDKVEVDYIYSYPRIDSLVRDRDGAEKIIKGKSVGAGPKPPVLPEGDTLAANFYVPPFSKGNDAERFDVAGGGELPPTETTVGRVPRTLAKMKSGDKVKIVCWGDSVTNGGDASTKDKSFPLQLGRILREKFPAASIDLEVIAVGGSGSVHWLFPEVRKHPREPEKCDWKRVVEARPDVVVMEFVNDSYLRGEEFKKQYEEALRRVQDLNAELVLVTPHFVYPADMGFTSLKEPDKRPYIRELKGFAKSKGLALGDTSGAWGNLWRRGIPYLSYLRNGINHPDDDGHLLMAEEIARCFASGANQ